MLQIDRVMCLRSSNRYVLEGLEGMRIHSEVVPSHNHESRYDEAHIPITKSNEDTTTQLQYYEV